MSVDLTAPGLAVADVRRTAVEPPRRWRNRWRAVADHESFCITCKTNVPHVAGEVFDNHCREYPSKDVAESSAAEMDEGMRWTHLRLYLGAFPV
jgi:hypothetical protein